MKDDTLNNRAATVLHQFQQAVSTYRVPDCVSSDKGGENVDVWRSMMHVHGSPSAVIAGSSTHNERIERLWRDMFCCVSGHYYELFYGLEEQLLVVQLLVVIRDDRRLQDHKVTLSAWAYMAPLVPPSN